jgi:hypothetical protein
VIWRQLTVHFGRAVSFPDEKPAIMQVSIIPLDTSSSSSAGLTFVNPPGVQEVVLAHPDNPFDGTRFTNDWTGHGMFVSIDNSFSCSGGVWLPRRR